MLDVRRQNGPIEGELCAAAARVLTSGTYILGPEVERFEAATAGFAGARHAVGLSSGTDALIAALLALHVGPGDEVICPSFTFFATASSVARVGAKPVFADALPDTFNLNPAEIEALIMPRTKAVIPVHLFGQPADMDAILDVARRNGLRVIEDAAQAFGAEYRGQRVGALGDCGAVSFYPSKNLGGFGDAGLLLTNNAETAERARLIRNHGAERQYFHSMIGGNFRLDALQAALLGVKLPLLERYTAARQERACNYDRHLAKLQKHLSIPAQSAGRTHIFNQYTIRVPGRRDELRAFLHSRGVGSAVYYPVPLHRQECFRAARVDRALPVTDALCSEVLSLPVFPELQTQEQTAIISAIFEFFNEPPPDFPAA